MPIEATAAIIGALSALVVSGLGALISYKIATKQIHANVVSASRQAWINRLRDCIAEFQAAASMLAMHSNMALELTTEREDYIRSTVTRLAHLRYQIELLINPEEDDHKELRDLVVKIMKIAWAEDRDSLKEFAHVQRDLVAISQQVFKREWETVKTGK